MTTAKKTKTYKIPEIRERTLFDYIAERIVPEIFTFTEYVTVAGFMLYLAKKTQSTGLYAFSFVLYTCVLWYVMDKQIAFVKSLEFQNVWVMRITSWILMFVGIAMVLSSTILVASIAAAQF